MAPLPFNRLTQLIRAGGVSAPSLPQSANIVFNMKADSLALADNATVSTWTDSSANALSFTGTGTFKTNQLGGKPCVRFSGAAGQLMTSTTTTGTALDTAIRSQVCTVMIIGKSNGTNGLGCMFGSTGGGNSTFFVIDGAQTSSTIGRYSGGTANAAPNYNASSMFVSAITSTTPYIAGSGTGLERQYLNGSCVSSNVSPAPVPSLTTFTIAAMNASLFRALVDIFDIVVWDKALSPTEVFQATNYFYEKYSQTKPWASVSNITIYDGDSISAGVGATNIAGSYPYKSAASLGITYGQWTNVAVGGITMANMIVKLPEWSGIGAALGKGMRVAAFEYFNQKGNATAIQTQNNLYATTVRGYTSTKLALGTTTSSNFDPAADRDAVNAYYDANFATYCDAYVPLHNNASIGVNMAQQTDGNTTYFSDGVHLRDAGYTVLASMFTAGLQAIQ